MRMPVAAFAFFCGAAAVAQQNDWIIVPSARLGPITAATSRQAVVRLFGRANVNDQDVDTGEGPEPATVVFGKDPSASLAILWEDNRIDRVLVCFRTEFRPCKWHTKDGVTLGATLPKLEILNGRPFSIEPWGSDVGGNITSWRGGKLAGEFGDRGRFHLLLTLNWQQQSTGPTPQQKQAQDEIERLGRDPQSSDSPVRRLQPEVTRILFLFPSKDRANK